MAFKITFQVPVLVHRYKKHISAVVYMLLLAFCAYVLYDPESIIKLVVPLPEQQQKQVVYFNIV